MANEKSPSLREQAESQTEGLPALTEMLGRWWKAKPSERKPYMRPVLDADGKPVIGPDGKPMTAEVRNSPIDPKYGYRLKESPPLSWEEAGYNPTHNFHPFEVARDAIKGIADIPQGLAFLDSLRRGSFAGGMTPEQYRDTFWVTGPMPMAGDPNAAAAIMMMNSKPMDIKDSEEIRRQDIENYKKALSLYGVYNPKTNELTFDWNGFARDLSQHPAEVGSLFVAGGAGFAKAAEGVAKLSGLENGLSIAQNLSRLKNVEFRPFSGGASAMQNARDFGRVAVDTAKAAAASPAGQATQKVLDATGKALNVAGKFLDPVTPLTGKAAAKTTSGVINLARRISPYKASIYTPEFLKEWGAFQKNAEAALIEQGTPPEAIKSPQTQNSIWQQFTTETNGRFQNPFNAKANRAFDELEAKGQGFNRYDYAPPHIGGVIDKTVNAKGKGITTPIIAEGAIRTAAPEGGGLMPRAPGEPKPSKIGITRSAATGEAPGFLQQNKSNLPFIGGRDLERSSRAATQGQLGDFLSESLGGRGAGQVTHQDIADDFIQTQINNRNAYRQAYEQSAASEGGGVYTDPDAFANTFAEEYAAVLRQQNPNLTPRDIMENPSLFPNAGTNLERTTGNIRNLGHYVEPIRGEIPDLPFRFNYNPATGSWFEESGRLPVSQSMANYLNEAYAPQIAAGAAPPRNMLNLQGLETERRRLLDASSKAYKSGNMDDYRAINAQIDALDNTAIRMAPTHSGENVQQAIEQLDNARRGFREWRQTGVDAPDTSAYAPVKAAAQKVEQLTDVDPNTGRYVFSSAPGARTDVGDFFRDRIVGEESLLPKGERPNDLVTVLTDPNSRLLSNPGLVRDYIRTGYARPGTSPQDLAAYHATYGNLGVLNPDEQNLFNRSMAAQYATDPNAIPQRSPWQIVPELEEGGGFGDKVKAWAKPTFKGLTGYAVGSALDAPIAGTFGVDPNLRWLFGGGNMMADPVGRAREALGPVRGLQGGAPSYSVNLPPETGTVPLRVSGLTAGYQNTDESERQRGQFLSLFPDQENNAERAQSEADKFESLFGQQPAETKPQGQYRGGRAAYKSGGKVGGDIEPLVRNLITKAKMAKKVSDKATEPLLNAHDDAIASALATAQKAI